MGIEPTHPLVEDALDLKSRDAISERAQRAQLAARVSGWDSPQDSRVTTNHTPSAGFAVGFGSSAEPSFSTAALAALGANFA